MFNADGEVVVEEKYKIILPFNSDGYAFAYNIDDAGNLITFRIDKNGDEQELEESVYLYYETEEGLQNYEFHDGLCPFAVPESLDKGNEKRMGYIDTAGNIVIPAEYAQTTEFREGIGMVWIAENMAAYIDKDNQMVSPDIYEGGKPFSDGMAAVKIDGSWGYIDKSGNMVISPRYEYAGYFSNGYALVCDKGDYPWHRSYYIDKQGNPITEKRFDYASHGFDELGLAAVKLNEDEAGVGEDRWGYINTKGEMVIEPRFGGHEYGEKTPSKFDPGTGLAIVCFYGDPMKKLHLINLAGEAVGDAAFTKYDRELFEQGTFGMGKWNYTEEGWQYLQTNGKPAKNTQIGSYYVGSDGIWRPEKQSDTEGSGNEEIVGNQNHAASGQETVSVYQEFCSQNYPGMELNGCLADVTHDGKEELILVNTRIEGKEGVGQIHIYTEENGAVREIMSDECHNFRKTYHLYEQDGKSYILCAADGVYMGSGSYEFNVFSLNSNGEKNSVDAWMIEINSDTSESSEETYFEALKTYMNGAKVILDDGETELYSLNAVIGAY